MAGGEPGWAPAAAGIYQQLEREILDGRLPPAAAISEPVLSQRFGVSRAPLREAIWRLERQGLLVRPPRQRARVVSLSAAQVCDIFALREALEGMAARQAAGRAGPEALAAIGAAIGAARGGVEGVAPGPAVGDFHALIAQASGNASIVRALEEHRGLIELCRRKQRRSAVRNERSRVEHDRIFGALADGDAEMAELTMRRHVANARAMLLEAIAAGG